MILDSKETKQKILSKFLKIVEFDGWTEQALAQAISDCGIDAKFSTLIFENGLTEIAEFYTDCYNQKTAIEIAKIENFFDKKIRDKIRLALYARFEAEKSNQIALQRLINFYVNPNNFTKFEIGPKPAIRGIKDCFKIANFIWYEIGDQSTDFNFYTKRLILSKIILRTLFVFLKDDSSDLIKTKRFIDSQIEKVMKFEKTKMQFKKLVTTVFLNENGYPKNAKEIVKNLPFFRLIK